jgi:hypothetical protein
MKKKPVVLTVDNLDLLIDNKLSIDGHFKLTENIFQHIDEYIIYGQLANHFPDDKFISENKNYLTDFGQIRFKFDVSHYYGTLHKHNLEIERDVHLSIHDNTEKLSDKELLEYADTILMLMSLFWENV